MFEDFHQQLEGNPIKLDGQDGLGAENPHQDVDSAMTPRQRFTIAILLLAMTAVIGALLLQVSAKIVLPFFG
jgi:hypothetical protein